VIPQAETLDRRGRPLADLRISLTDRCNFRCRYCMPREFFGAGHHFLAADEVLSPNEIHRLAAIIVGLGARRIRLTGGEPLLRREISEIAASLAELPIEDLALTTNGALLASRAADLAAASIRRVTISLDSLDQATFARLSDVRLQVSQVVAGIDAAIAVGLTPVRLNCVVQRGVNDGGVEDLVDFAIGRSLALRFIEFMDVGETNGWNLQRVIPSAELRERIAARHGLRPLTPAHDGEVARRYAIDGSAAEIGFISSVTEPFCGGCSRARLTADGHLVTCLFAAGGLDLATPLRRGAGDSDLSELIQETWHNRDDAYSERRGERPLISKIEMSYVGG